MLSITEKRQALKGRRPRRYLPLLPLLLLALLAGAYLAAGRVFADEIGAPSANPATEISDSSGQTQAQTKVESPLDCPPNYHFTQTENATPVAGTDLVTGSQCDDCLFSIALPFSYSLYDQSFSSVTASSNGQLDFGTPADNRFANSCLPNTHTSYAIFPFWYDLNMAVTCTGCGVYTSVSGSAPNRVFNIEYRAVTFGGGLPINFTVLLNEGQTTFDVIYTTLSTTPSIPTIGVQQDNNVFAQYQCTGSAGTLTNGSRLAFTLEGSPNCPTSTPSNTPTITPIVSPSNTRVPTNTFTRTYTRTPTTPTATGTPPSATPAATCGPGSNYAVTQSTGASIVPGTDLVAGSRCDDCVVNLALPFSYSLYGVPYTTAKVSSNGYMLFTGQNQVFANTCLPYNPFNNALIPYWDDLRTDANAGDGIFTSVSGSAPNRILNIEWRGTFFVNPNMVNFEVRLYEGQDRFDIVYGQVYNSGSGATVGVQRNSSQYTQFSCNSPSLSSGLQLSFEVLPCPPMPRNLTAHVVWIGRPAQPDPRQALTVTLSLRPLSGSPSTNYPSQNTDADGIFTVPVDGLPNGDYEWWVKGPQFLANSGTITLTDVTNTQVDMGSMRPGDANDDNKVDIIDFTLLRGNFSRGCVDVDFDSRLDFNGDCVVDSRDFVLLKNNFGNSGAR